MHRQTLIFVCVCACCCFFHLCIGTYVPALVQLCVLCGGLWSLGSCSHSSSSSFHRQQAHYASIKCWQSEGWTRAGLQTKETKWGETKAKWSMGGQRLTDLPALTFYINTDLQKGWMNKVKRQIWDQGGAVDKGEAFKCSKVWKKGFKESGCMEG